ncbi:hypothetical protein QVD17_00794 [Tagetes erecta]|uniref:Uncharacterized protein n=1 Tax=Tagetes erecta TaxID=13708 RepID=A0AAD8L6G2_TARER|nr:hypothetical protein QVD17_00794 [Tagetes erecta]
MIEKATPVLKRAIKGMANQDVFFDYCFRIVDLGCSSGMNSLVVVSNIIDTVYEMCQENNRKTPQFQVCLNDLFGNDFNNLFKLLPNFYETLKKEKGENFSPCFVSAVPGSFYERLFPDESLHFVHSSYSLHWLSQVWWMLQATMVVMGGIRIPMVLRFRFSRAAILKKAAGHPNHVGVWKDMHCKKGKWYNKYAKEDWVPEDLESNKLNIYIAKTSPQNVVEAYGKQFHTDFTKFLQLRSKEIVHHGRMVLTLRGRSSLDPTSDDSSKFLEFLTKSLLEMVKEGLVRESDINSFNIPFYFPHKDEVRNIIEAHGSFSLDDMNIFVTDWGEHDSDCTNTNEVTHQSNNFGKNVAKSIRAVVEPLFASHFGDSIIDELFNKCEKNTEQHLANKKLRELNIVVSLTRK